MRHWMRAWTVLSGGRASKQRRMVPSFFRSRLPMRYKRSASAVMHARSLVVSWSIWASVSRLPMGWLLKEVVGGWQTEQFECGTGEFLLEFLADTQDRKSTRLNSSHANISYAV